MQENQQKSGSVEPWVGAMLGQISRSFEVAEPEHILNWAFETFGEKMSIGTAFGVSGMVLLDMAHKISSDVDVFYIDTGLFFPETYDLIARAEDRYSREFRKITPEMTLQEQARACGDELWRRDPDKCCALRKVMPLGAALRGQNAWMTALRRDQSSTRRHTPVVAWNDKKKLVKLAPLANWTERDVWRYALRHEVPYNKLHDRSYPSIGCHPCTSPVRPGQDLRAGRWASRQKTECGLHL